MVAISEEFMMRHNEEIRGLFKSANILRAVKPRAGLSM